MIDIGGQNYAFVEQVTAPSPPWDLTQYDILIPVPAAYDAAGLDGFYLALPYKFQGGAHPRVNGGTVDMSGRSFQQVSWHYHDNHPWKRGQDDLETHIFHCKGFFIDRGAVNDIKP